MPNPLHPRDLRTEVQQGADQIGPIGTTAPSKSLECAQVFLVDEVSQRDAYLIDDLATAMMSPTRGTSPDVIARVVREHTVATTKDLKRPCDEDLEAALQIVPLIAVSAARGATKIGAPFGAVMSAVMKGAVGGTVEIGGDPAQAARKVAEALIREAIRQDADVDLSVAGVVTGAAEAEGYRKNTVPEAAIRGLLKGAAEIGPKTEETVRRVLQDTAYLPREPITRVLASRPLP